MEKGVGFLTVRDMIVQFPQLFAISLKRDEFLKLFKEIDSDRDGIVKYKEFEDFFNKDYMQALKNIEKEKEKIGIQFEIFDHLMKVLN
jgi:Ca2+-binding EF-hand superfamily protein